MIQNASGLLHTNLALPSSVRESEALNQVLPSRASPLLSSHVLKQLLPLVNKYSEVALVVLVLVGRLQVPGQIQDLRSQNSNLNFRRSGIRSNTRSLLESRGAGLLRRSGRLWGQLLVGVVASELFDAFLDVQAHLVLSVAVSHAHDAVDRLFGVLVVLNVLFTQLLVELGVGGVSVETFERGGEVFRILEHMLESLGVQKVVELAVRSRRNLGPRLGFLEILNKGSLPAFHGIPQGALAFFGKNLLTGQVGGFAPARLCRQEGVMSSPLSSLRRACSDRCLRRVEGQCGKRTLDV